MIEHNNLTRDSQVTISISCHMCKNIYPIRVVFGDYIDWRDGNIHVQDAMPYLSAAERELFISGTCDSCFNKLFPAE